MKDLKGGKYNITETALRSGFSGSKAMARAFRKNTEFFQANIKKMGSILEVGSEQLRKWNINKKKK